jgi:hypothetical protein
MKAKRKDRKRLAVLNVTVNMCITSSLVMRKAAPARFVYHEEVSKCWHVHQGGPVNPGDRVIVSLELIMKIDPTLRKLVTLPVGWYAERKDHESQWSWRRVPEDETD